MSSFCIDRHRVMLECWESEPAARPTFDWLHTELGAMCASWAHFEANLFAADADSSAEHSASSTAAVCCEESANVSATKRADASASAAASSRNVREEQSAALQRKLYCRLVSPAAASAAAAATNYDNARLSHAYRNLSPQNARQTKDMGLF